MKYTILLQASQIRTIRLRLTQLFIINSDLPFGVVPIKQ